MIPESFRLVSWDEERPNLVNHIRRFLVLHATASSVLPKPSIFKYLCSSSCHSRSSARATTSRAIGLETSFMQGAVARQNPSPGTNHPTGIMKAVVSEKTFHTLMRWSWESESKQLFSSTQLGATKTHGRASGVGDSWEALTIRNAQHLSYHFLDACNRARAREGQVVSHHVYTETP